MNDQAADGEQRLMPVTVLTGFLGSGKTTLLARLLRDPRFAHTAVIINEFGEVGLDHELLEQSREEMVLLANGCVCCTVRGDLMTTLEKIHERSAAYGIDRVVIETTGLADPAPILHTLMAEPSLLARFRLENLVTTIDAFNGLHTLAQHEVAVKQAAVADKLVLTKLDLVSAVDADELKRQLAGLNPNAWLHGADHGIIDPELLFSVGGAQESPSVSGWADTIEHSLAEDRHGDEDHGSEDGHHHHDEHSHAAHDSGITSFSITRDEPIPWQNFASWLTTISAMRGDDLLRVKGIVNVKEHPDQPIVIHGVQHVFHPPRKLDQWPSDDRRTRLVFITRDMDREEIDVTLEVFERKKMRAAVAGDDGA